MFPYTSRLQFRHINNTGQYSFWLMKAVQHAIGKATLPSKEYEVIYSKRKASSCCDMSQNDTIGKIELIPSIVLSSDNTKYKNDIQLFLQLFDEPSVYRDYH